MNTIASLVIPLLASVFYFLEMHWKLSAQLVVMFGTLPTLKVFLYGATYLYSNMYVHETNNLFKVDENSIEQWGPANIVQCCQQYGSALLGLN